MASGLRIELLGHFRLTQDDQPVDGIHARQQCLLTCLILHRHRPLSRQQIASLLWPDSSDGQHLTNLRRELHHLRRALPDAEHLIRIEPGSVRWQHSAPVTCDVSDFEAAAARGDLEGLQGAALLYQGDLLPDCFEEWINPDRERLRGMLIDALGRLVRALEERRAYADAIRHGRRLLALEPLDEDAYRTLMRLYALQGDRPAALHLYHTCVTTLRRELGVDPDPATQAAYHHLLELGPLPDPLSPRAGALPLVGRHDEWARLLAAWHAAAGGRAQMALIDGEAGIGKTRMAEELVQWCAQQGIATAHTRSYATEGRLAYAPISDWLRSAALRPTLAQFDTPWLVEAARLLPELATEHPGLPRPEPLTESWQRQRLLELVARVLARAVQPLLLVLDDLQWCDRDTLDALHYVLRTCPDSRLLVVGTLRSEETGDNPWISEWLLHLRQLERLIEITLGPLDAADTAALAAHVTGRTLDTAAAATLFLQTEGHPLFVVEIARAGPDGPPALPPKVQAVIAARLSRLSGPARDLVHLAATTGRDFSFDVLREASDLDERTLVGALDELWQRQIVREHGAHGYDFSHDRIREVAYAAITPATKRLLHRRVAQALELLHAPNLDQVSAHVATHYEAASQVAKAVHFYRRAADVANRVHAVEEVIRHLSKTLALLRQLPEGLERDREELTVLPVLTAALGAARGFPSQEIEAAFIRTKALGDSLGETASGVESLIGLSAVHLLRGEYQQSIAYGENALRRAEAVGEDLRLLHADCHWAAATAPFLLGELARARYHFTRCVALCDPDRPHFLVYGPDTLTFSHAFGAHALWLLGYPDQAARHAAAAITRAEQIQHPMSLAIAHAYAALMAQFRRDRGALLEHAGTAKDLCDRYGVVYYGEWSTILEGWSRSEVDPSGDSVLAIRRGLDNLRTLNTRPRRGFYLTLLAQAVARTGRADEACALIDAALSNDAQASELWWTAEMHRVRGEYSDDPEPWFRQAFEIARTLDSKSLELRAAVSLARLWRDRGEITRARVLLTPVCGWFTEGFDTADLIEARALLAEL